MRRALRLLSSVLIVAGALMILDAVLTVVWQEPVSALYARLGQDELADDLLALERSGPTPLELRALVHLRDDRRRLAFLARSLDRRAEDGDALARIRIAAIRLNAVVVQGTNPEHLRRGPGHYPDTPLPGERGTVAIAGHRTTYGAPFRRLNELDSGDRIVLELPYGRFTYVVERLKIVAPDDLSVLDRRRYDRLVLTACHPLYSAAKRIVAFGRLVATEPLGRARDRSAPARAAAAAAAMGS